MKLFLHSMSFLLGTGLIATTTFAQTEGSLTAPRSNQRLPLPVSESYRIAPVIGTGASMVVQDVGIVNAGFETKNTSSVGIRVNVVNYVGYEFETGLNFLQFIESLNYGGEGEAAIRVANQQDLLGVPILGKVNFSGDPGRGLFIKAGIMPTLMTGFTTTEGSSVERNKGAYNSYDVLAVGALGFNVPVFDRHSIVFDISYNRGILPTLKDSELRQYRTAILANLSFSWGL